jgi:hypothetical protein
MENKMNDDLPTRVFNIRFLHADLQKEQYDNLLAKNVKIGPSGAIEYTRIFSNSDSEYKGYYNGEYLIEEISPEELEDMKHHHHDHEDDDE